MKDYIMKTTHIALILFLCLFSFILYSDLKLQDLYNNISSKTDIIEEYLNEKDYESAYNTSIDLINYIDNHSFLSSVYVNYVDFDNINNEAERLSLYIKYSNISESHVSRSNLKFYAEKAKNLNRPTLKNIF